MLNVVFCLFRNFFLFDGCLENIDFIKIKLILIFCYVIKEIKEILWIMWNWLERLVGYFVLEFREWFWDNYWVMMFCFFEFVGNI